MKLFDCQIKLNPLFINLDCEILSMICSTDKTIILYLISSIFSSIDIIIKTSKNTCNPLTIIDKFYNVTNKINNGIYEPIFYDMTFTRATQKKYISDYIIRLLSVTKNNTELINNLNIYYINRVIEDITFNNEHILYNNNIWDDDIIWSNNIVWSDDIMFNNDIIVNHDIMDNIDYPIFKKILWNFKLNKLKNFIDLNKKKPLYIEYEKSLRLWLNNIKNFINLNKSVSLYTHPSEKVLATWLYRQFIINKTIKESIINKNIRNLWDTFIKDYQEYFILGNKRAFTNIEPNQYNIKLLKKKQKL